MQPECSFVDVREVWQHNWCTLVTSAGEQCPACNSLLNTLHIQAARQQNKGANSSELGLPTVSPAKREKAQQLKKARAACKRSLLRLLKSRQKLQDELTDCWEKLHDAQQDTLHPLFAEVNLSDAQLSVLEECIAVALM